MIPFSTTLKDSNGDKWVFSCEVDGEFDCLDSKRVAGSPMKVVNLKLENISFVRLSLPVLIKRYETLAYADDNFPQSVLNDLEKEASEALLKEYVQFMDDCNPRK